MADEIFIRLCGNSIIATQEGMLEQVEARDAWGKLFIPGYTSTVQVSEDIDEDDGLSFWPYLD